MIELSYIKKVLESIPQKYYGDELGIERIMYNVTRNEHDLFSLYDWVAEKQILQGTLETFSVFLHAWLDMNDKDFVLYCHIGSWDSKRNTELLKL